MPWSICTGLAGFSIARFLSVSVCLFDGPLLSVARQTVLVGRRVECFRGSGCWFVGV